MALPDKIDKAYLLKEIIKKDEYYLNSLNGITRYDYLEEYKNIKESTYNTLKLDTKLITAKMYNLNYDLSFDKITTIKPISPFPEVPIREWKAKATIKVPVLDGWKEWPEIWNEFNEEYGTSHLSEAIDCWLKEYCEHRYDQFRQYSVEFEDEEDAAFFKLSWMP